MIKQKLSILNLFAMDGGGKLTALLLSCPVVLNIGVYLLKFRGNIEDGAALSDVLSDLNVERMTIIVIALYWACIMMLLQSIGSKKKLTAAYTVRRLPVSEYEYCLWQTLYGVIVMMAFFGMIAVGVFGLEKQYMYFYPDVMPEDLFLSFRNSVLLRFFVPMEDNLQKAVLLLLCLASGVASSCGCCQIRHGRRDNINVLHVFFILTVVRTFFGSKSIKISGLRDWRAGQTLIIAECVVFVVIGVISAINLIKNKEERVIEDDQQIY